LERRLPRLALPLRTRLTRILILSEHAIYRNGLRSLLEGEPDLRVVGSASHYAEAGKPARESRPDILLLDLATAVLPRGDVLRTLATSWAPARLLVLASGLDKAQISDALRLGVGGVLLKGISSELLFASIRAVASGKYWVGQRAVDLVKRRGHALSTLVTPRPRERLGLTARELEIVSAVSGGRPNREIATQYGIGERTVKHHLTNIFDKLGLSNRVELATFALQYRLVATDEMNSLV